MLGSNLRSTARGGANVAVFVLLACSSRPEEFEALDEPGAKTVETGIVGAHEISDVEVLSSD